MNREIELNGLLPAIDAAADGAPVVIAGPCGAESREQVLETARALAEAGIKVFRCGLWKPRTMPGCFEGVGEEGLPWLREAKRLTGMLTATEVATPAHLNAALDGGVDILWLGARTTVNPFLVQEIADAAAERIARGDTVRLLVKNPVNPDVDLWIGAIQRLYNAGVRHISAVHRGFTAYGERRFRNPPQWPVAVELRRRVKGIQIICDPSHIGGSRALVEPLAAEAVRRGFDGLIVESHRDPDAALSDASQQLTPADLAAMLARVTLPRPAATERPDAELEALRQRIDAVDDQLMELLARRMEIAREIGRLKERHNLPVLQPHRYDALISNRAEAAERLGMSDTFARKLLAIIHEESVRQQLPQPGDSMEPIKRD